MRVPWANRPPTDFELLRATYGRHRDEYAESIASGQSIVMVPIDLPRSTVASAFRRRIRPCAVPWLVIFGCRWCDR